ncbi:MAG TPA: class I SAM-dependent methyltransferase [Candidatus Dojkabacteria bacterium]|nr:class I SAM-dependent methyltransferase [Candidatus Dojkabacteria bacterium]
MKKVLKFIVRFIKFFTPFGIVVLAERYYKYGTFKKLWNINTKRYWDYQYGKGYDFVAENYLPLPNFISTNGSEITILDVGCGYGGSVKFLSDKVKNAKVSGCDISTVAIERARETQPDKEFFAIDLNTEELKKSYDYITIVETLEHVDDAYKVTDMLLKHVKKALIVSVPYSPDVPTGKIAEGGAHVFAFNDDTFADYNHEILHKDILHSGTMPRIIYRIYPNK